MLSGICISDQLHILDDQFVDAAFGLAERERRSHQPRYWHLCGEQLNRCSHMPDNQAREARQTAAGA